MIDSLYIQTLYSCVLHFQTASFTFNTVEQMLHRPVQVTKLYFSGRVEGG